MGYFLNVENGLIVGASNIKSKNSIKVDETTYYDYIRYPDKYYYEKRKIKVDETFEEREAQRERWRIDHLTLTPADVERALYKAKGMDFDDLKALIAEKLPDIDTKALSIEFRAKDFYRGVDFNGIRLFDTVGALLGYTPEDMDYLFENKELPIKEEPSEDTDEDTTDNKPDIHDELDTEDDNTTAEQTDPDTDTAAEQDAENQGSTDKGQEVLQADESV